MKNLIVLLALIFTFQSVQSQVTDSLTVKSNQEMYDFYISKHKKLKTTGFILLGTGVVAMGVGYKIWENEWRLSGGGEAGAMLALAGTCATIASIPVFIVSGSHNRKAKAIMGSGEIGIGAIHFNDTRYASVGIKINF